MTTRSVQPGADAIGLIVEWAGRGAPDARLAELVGDRPHAVAEDRAGAARLWAARERQAECIAMIGIPHKLDVTVPVERLAEFADAVRTADCHPCAVGAACSCSVTWATATST